MLSRICYITYSNSIDKQIIRHWNVRKDSSKLIIKYFSSCNCRRNYELEFVYYIYFVLYMMFCYYRKLFFLNVIYIMIHSMINSIIHIWNIEGILFSDSSWWIVEVLVINRKIIVFFFKIKNCLTMEIERRIVFVRKITHEILMI